MKKSKIIKFIPLLSLALFLASCNGGAKPTASDLKLLETLLIDMDLKPAVVNVLIDYVLRKNNNRLTRGFTETIAGQWKRENIETAADAMAFAKEEHKKMTKIAEKKTIKEKEEKKPEWFDKKLEKNEVNEEEAKKLNEMMEKYR